MQKKRKADELEDEVIDDDDLDKIIKNSIRTILKRKKTDATEKAVNFERNKISIIEHNEIEKQIILIVGGAMMSKIERNQIGDDLFTYDFFIQYPYRITRDMINSLVLLETIVNVVVGCSDDLGVLKVTLTSALHRNKDLIKKQFLVQDSLEHAQRKKDAIGLNDEILKGLNPGPVTSGILTVIAENLIVDTDITHPPFSSRNLENGSVLVNITLPVVGPIRSEQLSRIGASGTILNISLKANSHTAGKMFLVLEVHQVD